MADTVRTRDQLFALFHDNVIKDIHPQQSRDLVASAFGFVASSDPTADNDRDDTAGVGAYFDTQSRWTNEADHRIWECEDGATGAAVWRQIYPQVSTQDPALLLNARRGGLRRGKDDDLRQLLLGRQPSGLAVPVASTPAAAEGIDELLLTRRESGLSSKPPRTIGPFILSGTVDDWNPPGLEYADVILVEDDGSPVTLLGLAGGREGRQIRLLCVSSGPGIQITNGSATTPANSFLIQPTATLLDHTLVVDLTWSASINSPFGSWGGGVQGGNQVYDNGVGITVTNTGSRYEVDITDAALVNWITISDYDATPGADRILFWDESAGAFTYLSVGSGLTLSGTTLSNTHLGSVTSVAMTVPSIFSIGGSPITSAGTLALTLNTTTAHFVWAGPTSGGAAAPTFRLLVGADLPVMVASGASHAAGAVPDPGATAGNTRYLNENAAFSVPGGTHLGQYLLGVQPVRSAKRANESLNSLLLIGA